MEVGNDESIKSYGVVSNMKDKKIQVKELKQKVSKDKL